MYSYLVLLLILGLSFGNGYVLVESGSGSVPKSSPEQDPEEIQKPLQDIEAPGVDSTDEEDKNVMRDLEDRFTAALVRVMEGEDDVYKDARFEAIIEALKSTMLTVTGEVNENYIHKVVESLRKSSATRRKQIEEVDLNKLGFSPSNFHDFLEIFKEDMKKSAPPASRSPRASASAISK